MSHCLHLIYLRTELGDPSLYSVGDMTTVSFLHYVGQNVSLSDLLST